MPLGRGGWGREASGACWTLSQGVSDLGSLALMPPLKPARGKSGEGTPQEMWGEATEVRHLAAAAREAHRISPHPPQLLR